MTIMGNKQKPAYIRWMIRFDMPAILEIENQSFPSPWSEDDFIRCLRQRNCIGLVAERENQVVGYMIYELQRNRISVLNLAVSVAHRRKGVAGALVSKLVDKLSCERRDRIMADLYESNLNGQLFFKSLGFKAIAVLKDWYEDSAESAYLMQYRHCQPDSDVLANQQSESVV